MINTAAIWILFPTLMTTLALLLRRWRWVSWGMTLFTAAVLTWLAFFMPMQGSFQLLFLKITLQDTALFFGREFVLGESERMMLALLDGSLAFWLVPIPLIRGTKQFPALGLGLVSIFTAVIAIRPFLFAALLIECAVLLCFPLLIPIGSQANRGLLRWLSQVSLSLPCILYSGWALSRVELASTAPQMIIRAALLMGVGFIFLLGVFPFHSFLPMMLTSLPPYITTYVLFLYTTFVSLFGIALINQFPWLKESPAVHIIIAAVGSFMIMLSGLLGSTQNHYGRLLSYVLLSEIGYSLLAIGVSFEVGLGAFYTLLIPRILALGMMALSLEELKSYRMDLTAGSLEGAAQYAPWSSLGLSLAFFSTIGLPPLAAYPSRLLLWEILGSRNIWMTLFVFIGGISLLAAGFRMVSELYSQAVAPSKVLSLEPLAVRIFLGLGILGLIGFGLVPQWMTPFLSDLMRTFSK